MSKTSEKPHEDAARATELLVSLVLRSGVLISAAVILAGVILFVLRGAGGAGAGIEDAMLFPHSLSQIWAGLLVLDPLAVITLGLILIILTPVSRVAVSIVAFAAEGDWRYVGITVIVLAVLLVSFAIGKAGG